jgi:hypothetical protein
VIILFLAIGTGIERRLRDDARRVWRLALEGAVEPPRVTWLQKFRNSRGYQRFVQRFKWYFLPDWIVAPLTVVLFCWFVFAAYTQTALPFLENGTRLCQPSQTAIVEIQRVAHDFHTRDLCSESFGKVREKQRYVVTFDVGEPWYDATLNATPQGIPAGQFPWGIGYLAAPYKRVIDANYLQPLFEIRPTGGSGLVGNIQIYPLSVRTIGESRTMFRADFTAARDGELFFFVNDAMLPFTVAPWGKYDYRYFYEASGGDQQHEGGNHGDACVTVESVDARDAAIAAAPPGPICAKTAARKVVRTNR